MKKTILSIILLAAVAAYSQGKMEWGVPSDTVMKKHGADVKFTKFKVSEKPDYKNKVMEYITAIDATITTKIVVYKVMANPQIDYLFINDKLSSVLEDFGKIDRAREKQILDKLAAEYGQYSVQKDKDFFIYSFVNDGKTKVMFYKFHEDGAVKGKVYYYTNRLFRMLLVD